MQSGRLRDRISIQNFTTSREDDGQEIEDWKDSPPAWAEVRGISSRDLIASGAEMAEATIRVWMRYRHDVKASSRLLCLTGPFRGSVLDIVGQPIPNKKGSHLEILCKQGVKR
ncbi:phage head closure protein [Limnobaculum xujianqingii]|uniref:phage head closure protein n=1 Tax=Limnobaculum xujianqingii TaxID=2738837 RepID=UPI0011292537|nr:phage head closure protein [Limnobaculum xujianqingii]